jgi:hypothetical protein
VTILEAAAIMNRQRELMDLRLRRITVREGLKEGYSYRCDGWVISPEGASVVASQDGVIRVVADDSFQLGARLTELGGPDLADLTMIGDIAEDG